MSTDPCQVAVNNKKIFQELIESLEAVSHLITRYAIFEELYLQRESAARHELEDMIVRLYAEVLTFLAKARKDLQSSATSKKSTRTIQFWLLLTGRLVKSIVRFPEDQQMKKIKVLDADISKLTEVLTVDLQIETTKNVASMHALLTSLNEPIKRIVDHTNITTQVLPGSQRLQLLQWLSLVPFSSHHKRHSESTIPGTGQWLLDHDLYLNWRNTSSSSIFLLHGILGSGKTLLASTVVESFLRESSAHASSAPVAYFYCSRSSAEAERSNPDEIMRSVLRQLTVIQGSSSTIHEQVLQEFERRQAVARTDGFEIEKLQAAECARLILDTTAVNPATIVIDAVDEIESSFRHVLLSTLIQMVRDSLSVIKVFVTSRDDSNIHVLLSDAVSLRITSKNTRRDMDDFVHQVVSSAIQSRRLLSGVVSDYLKQELVGALKDAAGEM